MSRDLFDDLKEKNAVAKSARTRVGGKGHYMMPSDYLSATEKKKLNGEIVMYEMKVPISWAKFKGYPKDIQREYIQWFVDEFGATQGMLAQIFEMNPGYVGTCLKKMGHNNVLHKMPTQDGMTRFKEWLRGFRDEKEVEKIPVPEEPKKKVVEQPIFFNSIVGCEMNLEGKASEIGQTLFSLFRDQKISVTVVFVGAEKESVVEDGNT